MILVTKNAWEVLESKTKMENVTAKTKLILLRKVWTFSLDYPLNPPYILRKKFRKVANEALLHWPNLQKGDLNIHNI